jgi:hypothetical protein
MPYFSNIFVLDKEVQANGLPELMGRTKYASRICVFDAMQKLISHISGHPAEMPELIFAHNKLLGGRSEELFDMLEAHTPPGKAIPCVVVYSEKLDSEMIAQWTGQKGVMKILRLPLLPAYLDAISYQFANLRRLSLS